ncbi:SDR family NAD(P)-dependent oxidoreductase [Novosphingobium profundi]|uniref:SDR family NAD(P)-dependent oxidoreductase n=1 Tax=Novosphingobium profundi TaxID=1774954 RepID=UPI001CFF00E8|nr:SDR family oxidoreductase [Novosphingobium profundi]
MAEQVFAGRTVIVTGSAGGIGSAIVEAFAQGGATVIAADLMDSAATAEEVPDSDGKGRVVRHQLDVSCERSWIALMDIVDAQFGGLDVLVNNAGIYRPNIPFEDMELATWREHFAVNADGTFLGCKHAIRRMKARGCQGAVVNIGSGMSISASPTGAAYCGSKAAVLMTTKTAARAAGQYGIRINAVLPGAVETSMLMGNMTGDDDKEGFLSRMESFSALGKLAHARDIAEAVLFLAGDRSSAISGVAIPVDGGAIPGA